MALAGGEGSGVAHSSRVDLAGVISRDLCPESDVRLLCPREVLRLLVDRDSVSLYSSVVDMVLTEWWPSPDELQHLVRIQNYMHL